MATTKEREKPERIGVRHAANAASKYFQSLFPVVHGFTLEETELSDDEKYWLITLGFRSPSLHENPVLGTSFLPPKVKFKIFKVNARTGEVLSMKNRAIE